MKWLLAMLLAAPAFAQLTTDQKVLDFQALAGLYAKRYAPYEWKKQIFKFDAFEVTPWLDRVRSTDNDLDFYELMVEYVATLHDGHDAYFTPSNFVASVPFTCDIYEGKVLIDNFDRTVFPNLSIGDELVAVDGVAVDTLLDQLSRYARQGNDRSTRRLAAARIPIRSQFRIPRAVDLGPTASITVRFAASGALNTYTVPWTKSGVPLTQIDPAPALRSAPKPTTKAATIGDDPLLDLQTSIAPADIGVLNNASRTPIFAVPQGFVRRLGGAAADYFYSGTYSASGKRIGFIRIPTYDPNDLNAALLQFQQEIAFFRANTDGLVVDQMRNNGGILCYGENIMANLVTTSFQPVGYSIRATLDYLQGFAAALANARTPEVREQYQTLYNALLASYNGGQRLTDPVPLCTSSFQRAPATDSTGKLIGYDKPLIMLIDEFSVSTADSVPAMIQDNSRGPLVGWRTNGMGGSNSRTSSRFPVGAYSEGDTGITLSLMVRKAPITTADYPPTAYIENVGVRPDIEIDYMTRDNLLNGGRTFVQQFTDIILARIQAVN